MPSEKGHRKSSKKDTTPIRIKIGYHPGTGQYRKYIEEKTYNFGRYSQMLWMTNDQAATFLKRAWSSREATAGSRTTS